MESLHRQETVMETYDWNGASAQLVEWTETLWCGKALYSGDNAGEPDVERLMREFVALGDSGASPFNPEEGWDVCLSINLLTRQRPSGIFFGFLVESRKQPDGFDLLWLPGGRFLRVEINEQTAKALEAEPWAGGVPPFQWVTDTLGPQLGFSTGDSPLPIVEYYRHAEDGGISGCWLYVPVTAKK